MVLLCSHRIPRVLWYSGTRLTRSRPPTGLSPSLANLSRSFCFAAFVIMRALHPCVYRYTQVWALPPSLATTKGIDRFLSFPPGNEMFQFPGCPSVRYGFTYEYQDIVLVSFLIRISADQCSFTAPRSFSQLVTSFFGVKCQGIHPTLFVA